MSCGEKEVCKVVMEDDGAVLLRNLERVDRNLRRMRCGMMEVMDGRDIRAL